MHRGRLQQLTRRRFLTAGAGVGAAWALGPGGQRLIENAAATTCPTGATIKDIEHVVVLMQENRSFDHYFGTYRAVEGFNRRTRAGELGPFSQAYPANRSKDPVGRLLPFRFDTENGNGQCTNDITHDWGPQHQSWNKGLNDRFVTVHESADGAGYGVATMGYYTRADLPWHHALADAWTLCDHWHCSVLGPTYPNRLYSMSGTIDPDGKGGGPVVVNPSTPDVYTWETMPSRLQHAGVSWKIYNQSGSNNNVMPFFKGYTDPSSPMFSNGLRPTWPADFEADITAGTLPQVSWVLAPMDFDEHPPNPVEVGAWVQSRVLSALVSNPEVWERTVLFITYDENGGFFDHVAPPVAPPGTPGEYLSVKPLPPEANGIAGPIGLGFRVPGLVVSPFSRGGLVCPDTFDHTSLLRFIEARFKVEVPNLSAWRRSVTGDLTSTLNLAAKPDASVPSLPAPSPSDPKIAQECGPTFLQGQTTTVPPYPLPEKQAMPSQEPGTARRPSGAACTPAEILRITVSGVPQRADRGFTARIRITHSEPLRSVAVTLDGRRAHAPTTSDHLTVRIGHGQLRRGRNRLDVVAVDARGKRAVHAVTFAS